MKASLYYLSLILAFAFFGTSLSVKQYITLFTERDQGGFNLTLNKQYANLSEHTQFLKNVSSYCAVGWIVFYNNANFNIEGGIATMIDHGDAAPQCRNRIFYNFKSYRYLGNQDTDSPGLSLYSKANYHGAEVFVNENGTMTGELSFPVISMVTTGWANYTFYERANFTGNSWCVSSAKKVSPVAEIEVSHRNVGSISIGCKSNVTETLQI